MIFLWYENLSNSFCMIYNVCYGLRDKYEEKWCGNSYTYPIAKQICLVL
ncbi:hypothetical protein [Cytobacillus citreus]